MIVGIMQPYFFPYIGYFHNIHAADVFVLCDQVQFVNESWITRNQIYWKNEQKSLYIRPQIRKSSGSRYNIDQVEIVRGGNWRRKLLKSIRHAYSKATYFEQIYPFLEGLIEYHPEKLSEFSVHSIQKICDLIGIKTKIMFNSDHLMQVEEELEDLWLQYGVVNPGIQKRQVRILEFCKRMGADHYTNTIAGEHLYSKERFEQYGIRLSFVKSRPVAYSQFDQPLENFAPNLSVIDVLMHVGANGARSLLTEYELV